MKIIIAILFACACLVACKPDDKTKFDNLEKVFESGNWRVRTINHDTLYVFFSREGNELYKVYTYKLDQGDSANSIMSTIQPKDDAIMWDLRYQHITLKNADEKGSTWDGGKLGNVEITKIDSAHILFNWGDDKRDTMTRTLPISTFLVRSKHDFLNGSNTAGATVDTVRRKK